MSEIKNVAKYSLVITFFLILSKLSGLIYDLVLASAFGATRATDIFNIARQVPNSLFSAIAAALVTSFIPIFAGLKNDKEKAHKFFNNILNIILILITVLAGIGMLLAPVLTKLFAKGFEPEVLSEAINMTRIVMPSIIFLGISGLYTGYLQSYGSFVQPAITGITANLIIIIGVLLFSQYGIIAAVISFFIGSIAQVLVQRPFMKQYKYKPYINLRDENVQKMLKLAIPTIISGIVSQISPMITTSFASSGEGNITIINYATKFSSIINQVFIISITTILYPTLTAKYANGEMKEFRDTVKKSIGMVTIVAVPLVFGLAALGTPVLNVFLRNGKFTKEAAELTALCLKYLCFSALAFSLIDILSKVYFSTRDTLTTMINGFITVVMTVIFTIILEPNLGVTGIVLAQVLSLSITVISLFIQLNIKQKGLEYKKIIVDFIKTIISGFLMAIAVTMVYNLLEGILGLGKIGVLLGIGLSTIVGAVVYMLLMKALKVEEYNTVINMMFGKFIKNKKTN